MFKSILILNVIFIKAIKLIMKICVINIPLGKTVFIKNEKEMTIYTIRLPLSKDATAFTEKKEIKRLHCASLKR